MIARNGFFLPLVTLMILIQPALADNGKLLTPLSVKKRQIDRNDPRIVCSGFNSVPSGRNILNLKREHPWALPKAGESGAAIDTIKILAMRFDFVHEGSDDPLTTGRGRFDFRDTIDFREEYGHLVDPSPHNRKYFESHLQALAKYYFFVSNGKLVLEWDVYPRDSNSVYHLPKTMGHYGSQHPLLGLTEYFIDCIQLVDTSESGIIFADYDSYFLFHAGSDRQNDLGFPETPSDLFTGYIFFLDSAIYVDNNGTDSTSIRDALIMPEMGSQDNRAVALNAVIAHEFGHQLGLIDLYRTDNFFTRVGDFALMDNNGFGTEVYVLNDSMQLVGRTFGAFPVYPMAWSRCFLGFDQPVVFREGTSIELVAAGMETLEIRVAKVPISEYEYYLLENRQTEIDGKETYLLADSITSVILGPCDFQKNLTGEYDFLLPGSGVLIWHIDEVVAFMDEDNDGIINFTDNQLQNDPDRPFIKLMEADGLVNFGGNYYSGYGSQEDMYYAANNSSFTPNTNPPAIGYGGTNTHIYVTNISESDVTMTFDLESDFLSDGFPQRAGVPVYGLSPVAADLDNDGSTEIILVSGRNILVLNDDGTDFTPTFGPAFYDTAYILDRHGSYPVYPVPLFARTPDTITAGPVAGDFGIEGDIQYVAVASGEWLYVYDIKDDDMDGRAELLFDSLSLLWEIVWLSFGGDILTAAVMDSVSSYIQLTEINYSGVQAPASPRINEKMLYGVSKMGDKFAAIAGDSIGVRLYYIKDVATKYDYDLEGYYIYGPVVTDLDRDGLWEVIVATPDGSIKVITIDDSCDPPFLLYGSAALDDSIFVNPVVADLDEDGYADMIFGGTNKIFAFDRNVLALLDFPVTIDRAFPNGFVISSPVVGDIDNDGIKDIIVATSTGSCYALSSRCSFDSQLLYGFPLAAGGAGVGSPLIYQKSNGGGLGFLGIDGWFYSYDVGYDPTRLDWPMAGGGPNATYYFPESRLGDLKTYTEKLPEDKFFFYPNPSMDGRTTFRYFLGDDADITLTMYDMSGKKVDDYRLSGQGVGYGGENWDLSSLPTGVYRCILEANFVSGEELSAFSDIAIIK